MHTITEVSLLTGLTAHTLRYYETLGLLPPPGRTAAGRRGYTARDVEFIRFIVSLKRTGMTLEDIVEFVRDGCILEKLQAGDELEPVLLERRVGILSDHLSKMEQKLADLRSVMHVTREKLAFYEQLRNEQNNGSEAISGQAREKCGSMEKPSSF